MGNNLGPNGLSRGCRVLCSKSIYPRSWCMKLTSQMPSSTSLIPRDWPARTVLLGRRIALAGVVGVPSPVMVASGLASARSESKDGDRACRGVSGAPPVFPRRGRNRLWQWSRAHFWSERGQSVALGIYPSWVGDDEGRDFSHSGYL